MAVAVVFPQIIARAEALHALAALEAPVPRVRQEVRLVNRALVEVLPARCAEVLLLLQLQQVAQLRAAAADILPDPVFEGPRDLPQLVVGFQSGETSLAQHCWILRGALLQRNREEIRAGLWRVFGYDTISGK